MRYQRAAALRSETPIANPFTIGVKPAPQSFEKRPGGVLFAGSSFAFFLCAASCLLVASSTLVAQQAPVNLGAAGNFVILSETGITDVPPSAITGNVGASPITGAAIHLTCAEVTGTISAVDAAGPAPCTLIAPTPLGQAISDMEAAYTNAAGRTTPDFTELGAGDISGRTLAPGLYKWSTGVSVDDTGVTLSGGPNAVWIFQIAGDLLLASNAHINLVGGAQGNNIFWQVAGPTSVTLGSGSVLYGNLLSSKQVILNSGATLNGRAFSFTQVTLQGSPVVNPGPLVGGVPIVVSPAVSSTTPANLATGAPIGNAITATFNEAMDPTTITALTFTLQNGLTSVTGVVGYAGLTATFTPSANLLPNTLYTATITTGAKDPAGVPLASNYVWTFTTGSAPDVTPPTVSSTTPANGAINVPIGNALSATFSEALNPLTVNPATFQLKQGVTAVAGTVTYSGVTATFTPIASLAPNLGFTATITTGVQDLSGNALVTNYVWTFTTGSTPDVTPPTVSSTIPANGAINVPIGNALSATFSEALNPLTVNNATFMVKQGVTTVAGTVTYSGVTATFTPLASLAMNLTFTATITTGVTDLAGNALATNYVWTFTTVAPAPPPPPPTPTLPTVISTAPANGATQVTLSTDVVVNFSTAMNPASINAQNFTVTKGGTAVPGTVSVTGASATFRPASNLAPNSQYQGLMAATATDFSGNSLASSYPWTFSTGAGIGQPSVCLANFAVLAGSAVLGSGSNVVTGDIGVSPGTSVTGFPPGILTGTIHGGDAMAAQAIVDFTAAYADAVSRTSGVVSLSGDIGGQTLTAGLYNSTSSLAILAGDLTLDAKGDPNATFIFQIASGLNTSGGRQIVLAGGAKAYNVFWQVGGSATLGTNSGFNGSILANQSITLNSGVTVNGRLLAPNGVVTLQSDTVTSPLPVIAIGGIVNASNDFQSMAAGSIATVFGNNLGASLSAAKVYPLPITLGGGGILVGTQSAPLFMTSCNQVNIQVPWEAVGQTSIPVKATAGGQVSTPVSLPLAPYAPGIFSVNMSGSGQGAVEIANTTLLAAPQGALGNPVQRGQYLAIFCTGLGPVTNQPITGAPALSNPLSVTTMLPTVTIGSAAAQVTYSGLAPGFAGLYQVNVVVPAGAPSGGSVSLSLSIGGVQSNTVTIAVQ